MNKDHNEEFLTRDISIEEFDHITDGVEDHVFSDRYNARKEEIMKNVKNNTAARTSRLGVRIAVIAAAMIVAAPFAVNAATGGEFFDSLFGGLWGNTGKQNVESHQVSIIESGKTDDKGNPVVHKDIMPKIEYVAQDPQVAERLIGGRYTTQPVTATISDTTITVETVVRDGMGIVVAYTVEREDGVNCFNYSQFDNEAKGAWFNDDQNIVFGFNEGTGKIWVDLSRSTKTKLYCYEYLCDNIALYANPDIPGITDHISLTMQEYTMTRREIDKQIREKGQFNYVKEEKTVDIPIADKLDSKSFGSSDMGTLKISPIAMQWDCTGSTVEGEPFDAVTQIRITYKDGSEYLIYDQEKPVASYGYICGNKNGFIVLFNRLVDTDNIAKITINNSDFTVK